MTKNKLMNTMLGESSPVTGSDSVFSAVGAVVGVAAAGAVVGVAAVGSGVVVGAAGVPVTAFDAGESPSPFTALMLTE
jgi:hypothetical protein